jgi:hypothetical protein
MLSYLLVTVTLTFTPHLVLAQETDKPKSPQKPSLWNNILSSDLKLPDSKLDSNQIMTQVFKLAQVLAIPLIDATKSISSNFAAASDHFDPFGMKEAQQTLRWQQEVIVRQHEEMLRWQKQEIERLQTELKNSQSLTKEKKAKTKKKNKTRPAVD